ncbi:MAG: hypothetical protein O4859_16065, partial [Trichodesmium sp. St18_bin1]|nr:hypothetical protein [Trichodesmium sp. St18_bin1]
MILIPKSVILEMSYTKSHFLYRYETAFSAIFVKAFLIASNRFESLPARIANYPGGFEPQII